MIAGLELGGTKCVAIVGEGPNAIAEQVRIDTRDPETTLNEIERILDAWHFDAIGIASFGPLDLSPGSPRYGDFAATPKPGWSNAALTTRIRARYAVPVGVETDVIGAALAEGRWGAAQGLADHVYITIGTGVGMGAIVNGRPAGGIEHGEGGHMRVARRQDDDFAGACPFHGDCLEGLIAGPALAARTGCRGDQIAAHHPVWDDVIGELAAGLHNLIVTLAPARISIGGGVFTSRPELWGRLRDDVARSLANYGRFGQYAAQLDARLGPPGLGAQAGPLGAIAVGLSARK